MMASELQPGYAVGRYLLFDELASGGMATVHIARLRGPAGFSRTVAIKRLHSEFAKDMEFVAMFLDEARLASRIQHPNVVAVLDVIALERELLLVMEYVHGEPLSRLLRACAVTKEKIPLGVLASILSGALSGLQAAHEATSDTGEPLGLVHRDISPQNIMVGRDGLARILDFGVAKASRRVQSTRQGTLKGKLRYMAPEQVQNQTVDRRTDVFAAGVVLWEALTGVGLYTAEEPGGIVHKILNEPVPPPSALTPSIPRSLDNVVLQALAQHPADRFSTARDMAIAIERALPPASLNDVSAWVERMAGKGLAERAARVVQIEKSSSTRIDSLGPRASLTLAAGSSLPREQQSREPGSEATRLQRPPGQLRTVALIGGSIGVAVLLLAALGWALLGRTNNQINSAVPSPLSATASPPMTLSAPSTVLPPSDSAQPTPDPLSSAKTTASLSPSASPPPVRTAKPPTATTGGPAPRPPNCNPPYTLDKDGTKHFKTECL